MNVSKFLCVLALGALTSTVALAAEQVQTLEGTGFDGKPCSVKITRDGDNLKNVELKGATEMFEILAENGAHYGPKTEVVSGGADEILEIVADNPKLYCEFDHCNAFFSKDESFSLTVGNAMRMSIVIELNYKGDKLVSVDASNKAKVGYVIPVGSRKFTCKAE